MKITVADVRRLVRQWSAVLGLSNLWDISIQVNDTEADAKPEYAKDAGVIDPEFGNYQALLIINAWQPEAQKNLDGLVAHELAHLVLYPIETALEDALPGIKGTRHVLVEQAVEAIGQSLMRVKRARRRK